jgi:hypothetical protein
MRIEMTMEMIASGMVMVAAIAATIAAVFAVRAVRFCSTWAASLRRLDY